MSKVKLIEVRDNVEEIAKIANDTQIFLESEHKVAVTPSIAIVTITYWFLRSCIDYLNENKSAGKDIELDVMGLINLGITYREGDAEKDANFTPFVTPGNEFINIVENNGVVEGE